MTTVETFEAIATIPNLRTLSIVHEPGRRLPWDSIVGEGPEIDIGELTKEMVQPLLGHPKLRGVFAYWSDPFMQDPQLLRELHAYPNSFSGRIKMSLSLMTLVVVLFVLTFQQHQAKLLLLPQSSLAPGFDSSNRIVLSSLLAAVTLITASLLTLNGANFLAAVAMALWIPVLIVLFLFLSSFSFIWKSPLSRFGLFLLGFSLFNFQMLQTFLPINLSGELNWLLMGYRTEWALIIILLEVGLLTWTICDLNGKKAFQIHVLSVTANNSSASNQTSSNKSREVSSLKGLGLQQISHPEIQQRMKCKPLQASRFFRRVMSPHWHLVWTIAVLSPAGMILLPLVSFQEPFFSQQFWQLKVTGGMLMAGLTSGVIYSFIYSCFHWEKRKKGMELEFCYPARRIDFAKQLWYGTGFDLIPMLLCLVVGLIFITPHHDKSGLSLVLAVITGCSIASLAHGSLISLLAFRSNIPWACVTLLAFLMTVLAYTLFKFSSELDFIGRIFTAGGALMVSLLLNFHVYGKLRDREWGDLAE